MVSEQLCKELKLAANGLASVEILSQEHSNLLSSQISEKYVLDENKIWWWSTLSTQSKTINYGDDDGLKIISRMVLGDPVVVLFVTDDESQPWPAFQGLLSDILTLIGEVRFFEYILTLDDLEWLIFDTHHNSLVVTQLKESDSIDLG